MPLTNAARPATAQTVNRPQIAVRVPDANGPRNSPAQRNRQASETGSLRDRQVIHLANRYKLSVAVAVVVAELAFGIGAAP